MTRREELEQLLDDGPPEVCDTAAGRFTPICARGGIGCIVDHEREHAEWCARIVGLGAIVASAGQHEHKWRYAGQTLSHGGSGTRAYQRCECGAERLVQ